ncbi:MAG TPA: aspartate-semialdehyde dehydrogenase, partial [Ignavibacteria bacterium]|nr:aspartate-semialdehyde dehydrogenase [Ignavibacteria bacterium]
MRLHDIAIVGASGLVGRKILEVLIERNFPIGKVITISSDASVGKDVIVKGKSFKLQKLPHESFKNIEFVFFSAGGAISHEYAPIAAKDGCIVIDNSSAFRMTETVPLVVPEVNRKDIFKHKGIISNPNCSTIQLVMALKPLDNQFKIKRVVVSTYQSVSGAGYKGESTLEAEIKGLKPEQYHSEIHPFPHKIAYNAIPQVDIFFDDGYTKEEYKMINETRKILGRKDLDITATCVRIPVMVGHSESVNIEFDKKVNPASARDVLSDFKGIVIIDDPKKNQYPMPIDCANRDEVFVGRIRQDNSVKN